MTETLAILQQAADEQAAVDHIGTLSSAMSSAVNAQEAASPATEELATPEWPRELPGIGLVGTGLAAIAVLGIGWMMFSLADRLRETNTHTMPTTLQTEKPASDAR